MFDKADTKTEKNAILSLTFLINWTRQLKKKDAFLRKPTKEIRKNRFGNLLKTLVFSSLFVFFLEGLQRTTNH